MYSYAFLAVTLVLNMAINAHAALIIIIIIEGDIFMARDITPVLKRCRSLGLEPALLGLSKKPSKRTVKDRRKMSEYSIQLREKQRAKFVYGVMEKQFKLYYEKAVKMEGISGENLLVLLENRLDNVVFRLGFARTRAEARQIVLHSHVTVNGKKVNIPSYQVKVGDAVEIKEASRSSKHFEDVLAYTGSRIVPEWLDGGKDSFKGSVVSRPTREQIDLPINETLIVELYSK